VSCTAGCTRAFPCTARLTRRSFVLFETLGKAFVNVVLPQLRLTGPAADDEHFQLKNFITDVLVTRHWFSHGHSMSVTQIMRANVSLLGTIAKLRCDPVAEQAATAIITACIADVHALRVPACPVALSVSSIACLFFTRALQRLCKAIKTDDITMDALAAIGGTNQDMKVVKECVWDGRCYLYHGKCNRKSLALLVSMCAISRLLRSLGAAFAGDADSCDADIMQLLARMLLCQEREILQAISLGHDTAYANFMLRAMQHVRCSDPGCRLRDCPYAAVLADNMARMRHLLWRTVPLQCHSPSSIIIGKSSKALRTRIKELLNVMKFVPNVATASKDAATAWLLANNQVSAIAKAASCTQPATAADFDR
jgi:hypothetical protein